jgi:hypothetical protein
VVKTFTGTRKNGRPLLPIAAILDPNTNSYHDYKLFLEHQPEEELRTAEAYVVRVNMAGPTYGFATVLRKAKEPA